MTTTATTTAAAGRCLTEHPRKTGRDLLRQRVEETQILPAKGKTTVLLWHCIYCTYAFNFQYNTVRCKYYQVLAIAVAVVTLDQFGVNIGLIRFRVSITAVLCTVVHTRTRTCVKEWYRTAREVRSLRSRSSIPRDHFVKHDTRASIKDGSRNKMLITSIRQVIPL